MLLGFRVLKGSTHWFIFRICLVFNNFLPSSAPYFFWKPMQNWDRDSYPFNTLLLSMSKTKKFRCTSIRQHWVCRNLSSDILCLSVPGYIKYVLHKDDKQEVICSYSPVNQIKFNQERTQDSAKNKAQISSTEHSANIIEPINNNFYSGKCIAKIILIPHPSQHGWEDFSRDLHQCYQRH